MDAASNLIDLSNGAFEPSSDLMRVNVKKADKIRDTLGIFVSESERIKPRV